MEDLSVKTKSEGVIHCCYGKCNSDTKHREKCERWIKACGRPAGNFNVQKIKRGTQICSKHFIGGQEPKTEHPHPKPALFHTDEQVCLPIYNVHVLIMCVCSVAR